MLKTRLNEIELEDQSFICKLYSILSDDNDDHK